MVFTLVIVHASGWVQVSDGLQFSNLSEALMSSNSTTLEVFFLDVDIYPLLTFGSHLNVTLACRDSILDVRTSLIVPTTMTVQMYKCEVTSLLRVPAVFIVLGGLRMKESVIKGLSSRAFLLYGTLSLRSSAFLINSNSLVTVQYFGVSLYIEKCRFANNTSPLGAVFLFSIGSSQKSSATNITVLTSDFSENVAALGGSVFYVNVLTTLSLSQNQLTESRSLTVTDSRFTSNSYIVIMVNSNAYLPFFCSNNTFAGTRTAFVVRRLSADISIQNSDFHVSHYMIFVAALLAQLTITEAIVTGLYVGPAVTISNLASISAGWVKISGLTVLAPTTYTQLDYSSVIGAINTAMLIEHVSVSDGSARVGLGGSGSFCAVKIRDVYARNMTCTSSIIGFLYSSVEARDLFMVNVTFTWGGFVSFYHSTATVRNLTADTGPTGYYLTPTPFYSVLVTYDSNVTLTDCNLVMPPIPNAPALYLWRSTAFVANLTFTALYAGLINAIDSSQGVIVNVTIGDYHADSLASVFASSVDMQHITLVHGRIDISLLSALSSSKVAAKDIRILSGRLHFLVASSHSVLRLSSWVLPALTADTLFIRIVQSDIHMTNLTLKDSSFDLAKLYSSQLTLDSVVFSNIQIRKRFITLSNSNLTLEASTLQNIRATTDTPMCQASKGSTLSLRFSHIINMWSLEHYLMYFSQSLLVMSSSSLSQCNSTFIVGVNSRIEVSSSQVLESGMWNGARGRVTAGFVDCSNCIVLFKNSQFTNISGTSGAVISIISSSLAIESCHFVTGVASDSGGFAHAVSSNISIEFSDFEKGRAAKGGAVSFECSDAAICHCNIVASNFSMNSAVEGGALFWTKVRPTYTSVRDVNNLAAYGLFEASLPSHIVLLNTNQSTLLGVAGVVVKEPILIGLFDDILQLVKTANSHVVDLISDQIAGATSLVTQNGIANFSGIIIQTVPGKAANIEAYSHSIAQLFPNSTGAQIFFTYETRICEPGEVTTASGCFLCPKYTFSFDPTDTLCSSCPGYASCPGGKTVVLDSGYWRKSDLSKEVIQCPIPEACAGGANSSCAQGYEGTACAHCSSNYYSDGLTHCTECEPLSVRIIRSALTFIATLALYLFLLLSQKVNVTVSLKILLEFLQVLIILPLINVDWTPLLMGYFSFNEMLLSFGMSSLDLKCSMNEGSLSHIYVETILASASLLVLLICLFLAIFVIQRKHAQRNILSEVLRCFLIAYWLLNPYLVKSSLSLLFCWKITGEWRLLVDVDLKCEEQARWSYTLALPLTILHVLALPCLLSALMRKRDSPSAQNAIRFFQLGYLVRFPYVSIFDNLLKTLFFTLLLGLSAVEPSIQMIFGAGFLYMCLHLHIKEPSHQETEHIIAKRYSLLLHTYLCAAALYFTPSMGANFRVLQGLGGLLFALITLYILAMIVLMTKQWRYRERQVLPQAPATFSFPEAPSFVPPPSSASQSDVNLQSSCNPQDVALDFASINPYC